MLAKGRWNLTLILLTSRLWWAPNNASRWQMGFNSYPANVENMLSSINASRWQMGFNSYPANVEYMVSSE